MYIGLEKSLNKALTHFIIQQYFKIKIIINICLSKLQPGKVNGVKLHDWQEAWRLSLLTYYI